MTTGDSALDNWWFYSDIGPFIAPKKCFFLQKLWCFQLQLVRWQAGKGYHFEEGPYVEYIPTKEGRQFLEKWLFSGRTFFRERNIDFPIEWPTIRHTQIFFGSSHLTILLFTCVPYSVPWSWYIFCPRWLWSLGNIVHIQIIQGFFKLYKDWNHQLLKYYCTEIAARLSRLQLDYLDCNVFFKIHYQLQSASVVTIPDPVG